MGDDRMERREHKEKIFNHGLRGWARMGAHGKAEARKCLFGQPGARRQKEISKQKITERTKEVCSPNEKRGRGAGGLRVES